MANTRVRIVLNRAGVRQLLKGSEIQGDLKGRADRIAAAAGEGFVSDIGVGGSRARAEVVTDTFEAMRAEATDRALSRAIDAGRG